MNSRHTIYDGEALFPRIPRRSRRQNDQMTLRHLLEEALDGNQRLREFWNEVENENDETSQGREAEWNSLR